MDTTIEQVLGRDPASARDAEGASLEQAKPGETLRQKDPASETLWKVPQARDTDGENLVR